MSFRDENCPASRRSLVYRLGHGWEAAICARVQSDARLALASVVLITKQFEDTSYEVTLPHVPWLREQSYINVQSIQPVKFTEFVRKASGKFDARVISEVGAALKRWLKL